MEEKSLTFEDGVLFCKHIYQCAIHKTLNGVPEEWEIFFKPEEQDMFVYRLGNYTLLEVKKNVDCGIRVYEEKKEIYSTSAYKLTKDEINYTEWTPKTLSRRQEKLANIAAAVWKINY